MTDIAVEFDFWGCIREHVEAATDPNPHHIAVGVVASVPDEYLRSALTMCVARSILSVANRAKAEPREGPTKPVSKDRRAQAVATYTGILKRLICTGPHDWKFLGDCTSEDLEAAADIRIANAKANTAQAGRYRHLAKKLAEDQTVADLPLDLVHEALQ